MTISMIANLMIIFWGTMMLLGLISLAILYFVFKEPTHEEKMENKLDKVIELLGCHTSEHLDTEVIHKNESEENHNDNN